MKLIEEGADPNAQGKGGRMTTLHRAIVEKDQATVEKLLEKNVNVNLQDLFSFTPLHYAVINNNSALVKQLLDKPEINIDIKGGASKSTPLEIARNSGYHDIVSLLQDHTNRTKRSTTHYRVNKKNSMIRK